MEIRLNVSEEKYDRKKGEACLNDYDWTDKEDEDGKGEDK